MHTDPQLIDGARDALPGLDHSLAEIVDRLRAPGPRGRILDTQGRELDAARVEHCRERLAAAGVGYRDRVLVSGGAGVLSMAWYVAAWHLGATLVPVDPALCEESVQRIADDSQARARIDASADTLALLRAPRATRFALRRPARVTGVDLAIIIYTSGSTGHPKGIMLSHANVLSALRAISRYLALDSEDVILCVPPLHFDYGLYQALFAMHVGCATVLVCGAFNPASVSAAIERHRPTVLPVVPAIGHLVARTLLAFQRPAHSVRLLTNTGGHLPLGTIAELRRALPNAQVMPMYGLTESKRALYMLPAEVDARPGSVGRAMPGLDARVFVAVAGEASAETTWREAAPCEIGMLFVRGASVMQGYVHDANGAGARLLHGDYRDDIWLATGDLFYADEDGYLYFHGRDKDLIKQAGHCLYPREIEQRVEEHDGVAVAVVIRGSDDNGDEIAELFVQLKPGASMQEVQAWLDGHLERAYRPRRIHVVGQWPLTPNGKIDLARLARPANATA